MRRMRTNQTGAARRRRTLVQRRAEGEGRAFVLLHGLTGHRDDFRDAVARAGRPRLAARCPTFAGTAISRRPARPRRSPFAARRGSGSRFLDAEGIEALRPARPFLRRDGVVAVRARHPERVTSLILMDTSPFAPDGYSRADAFEKAGEIARARGMEFLQQVVEKAARANPNPQRFGCCDRALGRRLLAAPPPALHRRWIPSPTAALTHVHAGASVRWNIGSARSPAPPACMVGCRRPRIPARQPTRCEAGHFAGAVRSDDPRCRPSPAYGECSGLVCGCPHAPRPRARLN